MYMCNIYMYVHNNSHTTILLPQSGDSAVILATQHHHFETLKELVATGANFNLQNQVMLWACTMYHLQLSILGTSECSNGISERRED